MTDRNQNNQLSPIGEFIWNSGPWVIGIIGMIVGWNFGKHTGFASSGSAISGAVPGAIIGFIFAQWIWFWRARLDENLAHRDRAKMGTDS